VPLLVTELRGCAELRSCADSWWRQERLRRGYWSDWHEVEYVVDELLERCSSGSCLVGGASSKVSGGLGMCWKTTFLMSSMLRCMSACCWKVTWSSAVLSSGIMTSWILLIMRSWPESKKASTLRPLSRVVLLEKVRSL
jgi:hypothetical protein